MFLLVLDCVISLYFSLFHRTYQLLLLSIVSSFTLVLGDGATIAKCQDVYDLSYSQRRFCRFNPQLLPLIEAAESATLRECQFLFKKQLWNCTGFGVLSSSYTREIATPETAFQVSLMSAILTKKVAQACKEGDITLCSCGIGATLPRDDKVSYYRSCSENIQFGMTVSKKFLDEAERDRGSGLRQLVRLQNLEVGRTVLSRLTSSVGPRCRCHGLSGTCSIKSCWTATATVQSIGNELLKKYDNPCKVTLAPANPYTLALTLKPICDKDIDSEMLIYSDTSPDYCQPDPAKGSYGTRGRECNPLAPPSSPDSCTSLCCGRGFMSRKEEVVYSCNCRVEYCCRVNCDVCRRLVTKFICN